VVVQLSRPPGHYEIVVPSNLAQPLRHVLTSLGVESMLEGEDEVGMGRYVTVFCLEQSSFDLVGAALSDVWKLPSAPQSSSVQNEGAQTAL
jgi:hypothetical protein